jgi:hypothetical protein
VRILVILAKARIQGARTHSLLDAGHSTKRMALSQSKGFHRHDEVLLGLTQSGGNSCFLFDPHARLRRAPTKHED